MECTARRRCSGADQHVRHHRDDNPCHAQGRDARCGRGGRDLGAGDVRVVAYVVLADGERWSAATEAELRQAALDLLRYMIPSVYVEMPSLPLTGHGKIDRHALPAPTGTASAASPGDTFPEEESCVREVWRDLL